MCTQSLQPAFVYVRVSCCTIDISAPTSNGTHSAEIARMGNAILASSVGVDTVDPTCLHVSVLVVAQEANFTRSSMIGLSVET